MQYYNKHITHFNKSSFGLFKNKIEEFTCNDTPIQNNRAIHNDIVYIDNGEVVGIKERNNSKIVGVLCLNKNTKFGTNAKGNPYYLFKPLNPKYPTFYVASKARHKCKIYTVIQFLRWDIDTRQPIGMLVDEIGEIDIINNEYKALLYKNNLHYPRFKMPKFKLQSHLNNDIQLQKQVSQYMVFSIDPPGCKDIDDAFHYLETATEFHIGVHITDITQYISMMDVAKITQSSSIYLPNEIRHLLPEIYSEDLCSLLKGRIRKTVMVQFRYSKDFQLLQTDIKYATVKVKRNYSYDQVEKLLSHEDETNLHRFFNTIKQITPKIIDSHSAVEYYMIEANRHIAEKLYKYSPQNTILRVHHGEVKEDCATYDPYNPLEKFLHHTGMEAAEYVCTEDDAKTRHNILDIKYYTHFTSPIRRLPDIYIHHQLKRMVNNEELHEITHHTIESMNKFQKRTRKLYNDIQKINMIYSLSDNYETTAYVIDYNHYMIKLFIPEFNITHKTKIYSNKVKSLVNVEYNDTNIIIDYENKFQLKLNKYQQTPIRLNSLTQ
jgi:exoribonuclease R